jgi:nitroreductase
MEPFRIRLPAGTSLRLRNGNYDRVEMEFFDALMGRRSIRRFTPGDIDENDLARILRAGMAAPSAGNEHPWHFIIVRNRENLRQLSEAHPYAEMVKSASLAVLVCADMEDVKHRDFWPQDCAAATENMLLATHSLGLGSVWIGVYPREARITEIRRIILLPERVIPFSLLPIGIPAEKKPPGNRFTTDRLHEEHW